MHNRRLIINLQILQSYYKSQTDISFKIYLSIMSNSAQRNDKLLIKQKDYELLALKRVKHFQIAIQDPLLNPAKKKQSRKAPLGFQLASKRQNNAMTNNQINPLTRRTTTKIVQKSQQPSQQISANPQDQQNKPNECTPWETILGYFLKVYDYRPEQYEARIVNVFGSQGVKEQQQLRFKLNGGGARQSVLPFKKSQIKQKQQIQPKKQLVTISITKTTICMSTYMKILSLTKIQLKQKWKKQDKVASLQLAIQSLKLLHDTSNAVSFLQQRNFMLQNLHILCRLFSNLELMCFKESKS